RENVKPSTLLVCHRCSSSAFAVAARPIRGAHRDTRRPILWSTNAPGDRSGSTNVRRASLASTNWISGTLSARRVTLTNDALLGRSDLSVGAGKRVRCVHRLGSDFL